MAGRNNFWDRTIYVFSGDSLAIDSFYLESASDIFPHIYISPRDFLRLTNGNMPRIYLLQNDSVCHQYNYRNLSETAIKTFFE